jgi:Na+-driven multidrug efflux pump
MVILLIVGLFVIIISLFSIERALKKTNQQNEEIIQLLKMFKNNDQT